MNMSTSRLVMLVASAFLLSCTGQAQLVHTEKQNHCKVAIIGAGIGGAFTAHNLRQLLNDSVDIHVYVRSQAAARFLIVKVL